MIFADEPRTLRTLDSCTIVFMYSNIHDIELLSLEVRMGSFQLILDTFIRKLLQMFRSFAALFIE